MLDIQSAIDHIKTAVDVDPWAAETAEKALEKAMAMKWRVIKNDGGQQTAD